MTPDVGPGWYADPGGGDGQRYWTGEVWAPDQQQATAPAWPQAAAPTWSPQPGGYPTDYLSSHDTGFPAGYPGPLEQRPAPWRRAATWLALSTGLVAGFGAGFAVADARKRGVAKRAPVSSSAPGPEVSTAPEPTPSEPTPSEPTGPEPTGPEPTAPSTQAPPAQGNAPQPPPPGDTPLNPTDPAAALLDQLGLRPTDVEPAAAVGLIEGGDQVRGQKTLDLCKAVFPSESHRTARRQLVAVDATRAQIMSTEAVLYDSPAALANGFTQLKRAAPLCKAKTGIDKDWPQVADVQRLVFETTGPGAAGAAQPSTAVYLRRDRTLLALYFRDEVVARTQIAGQKSIQAIVAVFARRLADLPSTTTVT